MSSLSVDVFQRLLSLPVIPLPLSSLVPLILAVNNASSAQKRGVAGVANQPRRALKRNLKMSAGGEDSEVACYVLGKFRSLSTNSHSVFI